MEEIQSSRIYEPHAWRIIKLTNKGETFFRVLGSWYGNFTTGDSWRMSSPIQSIEDAGTHWVVRNASGSVYVCGKGNEGMSAYTASIYSGYEQEAAESEEIEISISCIEEFLAYQQESIKEN